MPPHRPLAPVLLTALLALPATVRAAPAAPATPQPWQGKLSPCLLEGGGEALCGTYEVFENRESRAGRKIGLRIVLLPATGPGRAADPVFYLSGGPGEAATESAPDLAQSALRARRDLVFVDIRGTGGSNPLACPIWGDGTRLDHIFSVDAATACRDELRRRADLTQYTTAAAMDDVDEVRRHLGYGPVNLLGGSYGTYAAQIFLARHPEAVRSLVLSGVVNSTEPSPLYHARNAQQALTLLARDCAAEPACQAAFPHFLAEVSTVLDRLAKDPARVSVKNPTTGKPVEVRLTRSAAADAIRFSLYNPQNANQLPRQVHLAIQGDFRALAGITVQLRATLQKELALGLFFSMTCAEDLTRIDPKMIPAVTHGTFYGDERVREQLAVCAIWPHAPRPAGAGKLPHSDVPALLLSGERDPVTPPAGAALVAKGFSHGLWVQIPHGAHNGDNDCENKVMAEFVERGSAQGLDVACLKAAQSVPFVTKPEQEPSASRP